MGNGIILTKNAFKGATGKENGTGTAATGYGGFFTKM
jgi:hypothetical protein